MFFLTRDFADEAFDKAVFGFGYVLIIECILIGVVNLETLHLKLLTIGVSLSQLVLELSVIIFYRTTPR